VSGAKAEIIRTVYDRWAEGDFRAGADLFDQHVLFVIRPEFPDSGAYHGPDGVVEYMHGFLEPWTRITITADEVIAAGDSVVVAVTQIGTGEGSGAATELRYFHVWTFRGTSVIRWESVRERAEALELVGLSPDWGR
jgi:ketosteroid isomerase-like protein